MPGVKMENEMYHIDGEVCKRHCKLSRTLKEWGVDSVDELLRDASKYQ